MLLPILFYFLAQAVVVAATPDNSPKNESRLHYHDDSWTPDYYLYVTYGNHSVACQSRMSVLVNGSSPGPELRLPAGKTSWIRVCNRMKEFNTTIHWHGLSQRMAPFSDGSPVTQWPIAPNRCFDYEIHPEEDDAGSYFYHSHVGFQAISASGPLIIEDPGSPPYEYDEERLVFLQDYYNKTDVVIEKGLVASPLNWSGEVNAVLINGIGVASNEKAGTGTCQLPVIDVEPGKSYRFRFISATAISMVAVGIEGHSKLDVVGADGHYTKPSGVDHIVISSGQRFEVLLKAKTTEELGNKTDYIFQFETRDRPTVFTGFGVLRYSNARPTIVISPPQKPISLPNNSYDFLEYALEPLAPNGFPSANEVTRRIYVNNQQLLQSQTIWQLNGLNWTEDSANTTHANTPPYLVDIYKNGPAAMPNYTAALENYGWDPYTLTWPAKLGEVLEIILVNTASIVNNNGGFDTHPFHIHGSHYYDCGSGNGTYDPVANEEKLKNYNPVLRDTTTLYRYREKGTAGDKEGWRCWRLRVTSPGCWMLHCHILQHMIMGMQSVWIMGDYEDITKIPYEGAKAYLDYNGKAYIGDNSSPEVWHDFDNQLHTS